MCGINGIIHSKTSQQESVSEHLRRMNTNIAHRGPDDDGFYVDTSTNYTIGMAMRRLAIIDLETGKQPMCNSDHSIVIVFNGEIYNYKILKSKLEAEGIQFQTESDTEVILKLYESKGVQSFKELDGMYAFSIYDKKKEKVFIARDFFGEKPLYYTSSNEGFIWASELKSIVSILDDKPEISKAGLNLFFKLTYIPAPHTIYDKIFKLEANHYLEYDLANNNYSIHKTHNVSKTKQQLTLKSAGTTLHDLVMQSIESRSVSDVPLGTFLSGGVDSSIVSLGLSQLSNQKIDTFSIGFDKASFDETDKSRLVAKQIHSNHHEFILTEHDVKSHLDSILLNFDEPFADSSALPSFLVAKKTRGFVKVALTGDGGDEVFGGYNKYYIGALNARYTSVVPKFVHYGFKNILNPILSTKDDNRGKRFKLKKFLNAVDYNNEHYWNIIALGFNTDSRQLLNNVQFEDHVFEGYKNRIQIDNPSSVHDYREIDRHLSLEGDMLVKVDRTSMLNSLECRAPFLNKTLWEFSNSLPDSFLLKSWDKKIILKEAFKHEFPTDFLNKPKKGFVVPVGDWLRSSLRQELESYIDTTFLETQNMFNIDYIKKLIENHLSGKEDNSYKAWTYYTFQKWYKMIYSSL